MLKRALASSAVAAIAAAGVLGITAAASGPPAGTPTYTRDVAPILYQNCVSCHRPGEIAPMSLLTYQEVRPWARAIREQVVTRRMPPWHADPQYGEFHNAARLKDEEIDLIARWASQGAPQGDPADLPPAPRVTEGWNIGTPDAVFTMAEEFEVPADGVVEYQHFTVPTDFTEDRFVQAVEVRPGNRAVVHHIMVYVQEPGGDPRPVGIQIGRPREATAAPATSAEVNPSTRRRLGIVLAATGVGTEPHRYVEGAVKRVKAGSTLMFQVHYTPNGTAATDRSSVGMVFAKAPPRHEVRTVAVANSRFVIPPNASNYMVESEARFTEDARIWSLLPHMHVRGKSFEYTLEYPDGRSEIILSVPKFAFDWQRDYHFVRPLEVPKGTRLLCTAYFDNSAANPVNPDPAAEVRWGDQTWEEMMIGWTTYSVAGSEKPTTADPERTRGPDTRR